MENVWQTNYSTDELFFFFFFFFVALFCTQKIKSSQLVGVFSVTRCQGAKGGVAFWLSAATAVTSVPNGPLTMSQVTGRNVSVHRRGRRGGACLYSFIRARNSFKKGRMFVVPVRPWSNNSRVVCRLCLSKSRLPFQSFPFLLILILALFNYALNMSTMQMVRVFVHHKKKKKKV